MAPSVVIPSYPSHWQQRVDLKKIQNTNIHSIKLSSASTIKEEQFLALRVLWKFNKHRNPDLRRFDLETWVERAEQMLEQNECWQIYIKHCATDVKQMPGSTFFTTRYWQAMAAELSSNPVDPNDSSPKKVYNTRTKTGHLSTTKESSYLETPTKLTGDDQMPKSDSPEEESEEYSPGPVELLNELYAKTEDEEIVTAALFNLLAGLVAPYAISNRWTVHRKPFKARFKSSSYQARVDGYLEDWPGTKKVRALVEVKPMHRFKENVKICMQEAGEMVAWIKSHPDKDGCLNRPGRRILVAQDRHEIYITIAEYSEKYIKYLTDDCDSDHDPHFLTMHQFGPWVTNIPDHMRSLGKLLLAINLRALSDKLDEANKSKEDHHELVPEEDDDITSLDTSDSEEDDDDDDYNDNNEDEDG